jgi:hypothetical protein
MEADPTQQPIRGSTKLALLKGVWVVLTLAGVALLAGSLWARNGFWYEHLDLFTSLWWMVLGSWMVISAEIERVRERLQLSRKRTARAIAEHALVGTTFGLAFIGMGLLLLLDTALRLDLSVEVGLLIGLGWLGCCFLVVRSFSRWRNHQDPPPMQ